MENHKINEMGAEAVQVFTGKLGYDDAHFVGAWITPEGTCFHFKLRDDTRSQYTEVLVEDRQNLSRETWPTRAERNAEEFRL